jgi:hypothetical protein
MALPYELEALKPGMARIYNGSNRPLVLQFEDAENRMLTLEPFTVLDFKPKDLSDNQFSRIFIYGRGRKGDMEMVHTSKLFFEETTTNYFFLYPQGKRRIRIMRIAGHAEEQPLVVPPPAEDGSTGPAERP